MFNNRGYRAHSNRQGLTPFTVTVKETNLHIQAKKDLTREAVKSVLTCRGYIENHIFAHPDFSTALVPVRPMAHAPEIVREMMDAAIKAGVGPMAAIAGAVAQYTGKALLHLSDQVIVENGGDVFLKTDSATTLAIFAGKSPLSMKVGVKIAPRDSAFALCTSSGTIGHSKSFGKADAVTILSNSCPLADAVATALANRVQDESDIQGAIDMGKEIPGVEGIIVIKKKKLGAWGEMELVGL
ncbi:hypothetical protein SAMN02746065_11551 [Desulfocicer vacuolatum DSM 3385]|uniref:Uncharacterized protein n=1 Tax=Desulfocicer vacuolatum DSM 3385 TaxID=1121400 RepID=A0A1W2D494_9BACT|nr:UPF0280 family protein [Desulfocicer vacuolatum]SMC92335.1 hypothetical protein SAMN02746065_11551 [Desulfocicer vacuolatum DSM 3385]